MISDTFHPAGDLYQESATTPPGFGCAESTVEACTAILGLSSVARAYETVDDLSLCAVATPTAAPAADQPTSLSAPLVLPSVALPAPYPLAHTSDTTSTSLA